MSKYQVGMTSYAELHWEAGRVASRPYLICLDCGEHWFDIAGKLDILKRDHTGPEGCPADRRSAERYGRQFKKAGPAAYRIFSEAEIVELKEMGL